MMLNITDLKKEVESIITSSALTHEGNDSLCLIFH